MTRVLTLVGALVLSAGLAACGGGDADTDPQDGADASTEQADAAQDSTDGAAEADPAAEGAADAPPGTDPDLDEMWVDCADGSGMWCDFLYSNAPEGSEYSTFGATCGGLESEDAAGTCELLEAQRPAAGEPVPGEYGADPALDALWDACEGADMSACDELFWAATSEYDAGYYAFGATCGETLPENVAGNCEMFEVVGVVDAADWPYVGADTAMRYGADPILDGMRTQCEDGEMLACDALYYGSPYKSQYVHYASTCGYRADQHKGSCASEDPLVTGDTYGTDPEKDALWDTCAAGDSDACAELWHLGEVDSGYFAFAETCGDTTDARANCFR